jgi:hypothetical protein
VTTGLDTLWEVRRVAATILAETIVEDVASGNTADLTSLARSLLNQYIDANAALKAALANKGDA